MKRRLALGGTIILFLMGCWHAFHNNFFYLDAIASLVAVYAFWKFYDTTHQTTFTFSIFLFWLILHTIGLYDRVIFIVGWDRWMHLLGGIVLTLFAWQWFSKDKWSFAKIAVVTVLFALGIGAFHEIIEWLGYRQLGVGQGFLLYGAGDFGEWQNAILDMASNLIGALLVVSGKALNRK